ncbi:Sensor histidine kinase/response regulator [Roseibacterium elongatum DSM 19469]|uniref:Sensory/regulatory protein RpfC n=1 Tax=Roseicyclus elongatus DSM 19469 TaxID=1294273 RepID=W8S3Q4_9RHOB|nr:ATP-binding protein [Roseibacterium elongatum]AHM03391.1 Sensor histidine kinase/response regulator [Roseibacterium elongatum DSM 19469]
MGLNGFDDRLAQERRARLQAERLLALRSEELYSANRKLAEHAHALSHKVITQREENATLRGQQEQASVALDLATDRAALAERRLWDALTTAENGFAIFDADCRLVIANPAWLVPFDGLADVAPGASYESILRLCAEEGIVDLQGDAPEDWVDTMLARWECTPTPQTDIKLFNGTFVRLNDKRSPQGDTVCLAVDITHSVRREQQLREARDAALAASRAKSAFLANMSHEIRTPMNGVLSMAELLRDSGLTEDQMLFADTIRNSGEALLVIINDILDYSKIEAGKLVLHREAFDLPGMIHEIFRLLRPSVQGRDLRLSLDYDLFLPDRMIGDPGRVRQILTNLIGNAVKFTPKGDVLVRVVGDPPPPEGETPARIPLRIVVEDTGIGIAPEMQCHIFGEFNQVEDQANRRHDGTGLGLAITHRLVRLMGGEIWLDSTPGKGSSFGFRLELETDPATPFEPVPPLPQGFGRVLMVGEAGDAGHALQSLLLRLQADVQSCSDPTAPGDLSDVGAFVFLTPPDKPDAVLAQMQDAGLRGPVLGLATDKAPAVPGGMTPLSSSTSLAELRVALMRPAAAPPSGDTAATDKGAQRRLRLLAAEDNKTNQLVFRSMLKSLDIDLTLVEDGAALVAAYHNAVPDLIFTDISMPGMDGTEAAGRIRAFEQENGLGPVPIVAMTAHAMAGDRDRILACGIDDYMTKPLKKDELFTRIATHAPADLNPVPRVPA